MRRETRGRKAHRANAEGAGCRRRSAGRGAWGRGARRGAWGRGARRGGCAGCMQRAVRTGRPGHANGFPPRLRAKNRLRWQVLTVWGRRFAFAALPAERRFASRLFRSAWRIRVENGRLAASVKRPQTVRTCQREPFFVRKTPPQVALADGTHGESTRERNVSAPPPRSRRRQPRARYSSSRRRRSTRRRLRFCAAVVSPPCRNTPDTTRFTLPTPRATWGVRSASLRVLQS